MEESSLPIRGAVQAGCEMLGLDPIYVANEGILVAMVPEASATAALECMRPIRLVRKRPSSAGWWPPPGLRRTPHGLGGTRIVDLLPGDQLPESARFLFDSVPPFLLSSHHPMTGVATNACPAGGAPASGKFCGSCGATRGSRLRRLWSPLAPAPSSARAAAGRRVFPAEPENECGGCSPAPWAAPSLRAC